jgi:hypothetical protein
MADSISGAESTSQAPGQTTEAAATRGEEAAHQSTEAVSSTGTKATPQAPAAAPAKTDIFASEEFRKWESNRKKQEQVKEQQYRNQMAQLQQQMQQFRLQSVPEEERVVIERDTYKQQLAQYQQEQQQQEQLAQRWNDIQKLAAYIDEKPENLWEKNFSNIGDAAFHVLDGLKARLEQQAEIKAEEIVEKRARNTVDLGGGGVVTTDDAKERKYKDALKAKDGKAFVLQLLQDR